MSGDLYAEILGLPAGERPPNLYELLAVQLFESDGKKIHAGGLKQIQKLKRWQLHPDAAISDRIQQLLNEVSRACTILEMPDKKKGYDVQLA